ncbi:MAG: thiamine phosphate synthase [Verrucomicrobiae bacterium]|nr:thiamine phosphate synthase [Verrucomicrobiae bacterium]
MPRSSLLSAKLYGIVDLGYVEPSALIRVTAEMIEGGIDVIQLRAKARSPDEVRQWSEWLLPVCREAGVPFFVNDYPDIAASIGVDGVHVGQDDASMDEVRAIVGDSMLVGRSTHSLDQAAAAAADPRTDCIGFGPLFATPTKPDYSPIGTEEIREVHARHPDLPVFCIGGIKKEHLPSLVESGAKRVVIVSGILQAPDIAAYVRAARLLLP